MAFNIKSKSGRAQLEVRREPYWSRIRTGLFVGYRKLKEGEGTWVARRQNQDGKKQYQALGTFLDEGGRDKAFDAAVTAAIAWNEAIEHGVSGKPTTIEEACKSYVTHIKAHKSEASSKDAEGRFKRLVYGKPIGHIQLAKLKTTDLKSWLNSQVDVDDEDEEELRRAKDSANRNLNTLKAALNLALKDRLVATDQGWKTVTSFKGVGKRRTGFLTIPERKSLLDASPKDLQSFIRAMLLTAARPGELASLKVSDFDREQGTLELEGKTGRRTATLSTAAVQFFKEQAKGKLPSAPLLNRADGMPWDKDWWKKLFKEAVRGAGLPPNTVMYTLRHVAITELVNSGMDSFLVAKLAGTSTAMIDKHYGQLRHKATRKHLDAVKML